MRILATGLAFLLAVAFAGSALSTPGGQVILYGGAGQGKVIFDGRLHASKGMRCNDCHSDVFATAKKALISMEDHSSDKACFACHNGKRAFAECDQCHRKF